MYDIKINKLLVTYVSMSQAGPLLGYKELIDTFPLHIFHML